MTDIFSSSDIHSTASQVRHTCGYELTQVDEPELYDVTPISAIPKELKGVSWDRLPRKYHKYIQIGTLTHWQDHGAMTWKCPQCGASLSTESVVEIEEEKADGNATGI